jgi:Rieske Fe-S protein
MPNQSEQADRSAPDQSKRRSFLSGMSTVAMTAGLVGGYGAFAFIAGRFLYPARARSTNWLFVSEVDAVQAGDTLRYRGPAGETVNITRQARGGTVDDFIALSSVCPHLGCQVHWEPHNDRYFCPCHNGEFDASGSAYAGPPGDAGQSLPRYPLKIDGGLLFIEMPVDSLTARSEGEVLPDVADVRGPGHDPCLARVRVSSTGSGRV